MEYNGVKMRVVEQTLNSVVYLLLLFEGNTMKMTLVNLFT